MTIGIVCACKDGVVVGADRKTTRYRGTRVKSLEEKIAQLQFDDGRGLLVTGSGIVDQVRRAIERIDPKGLGHRVDIDIYRAQVESRIALLRREIIANDIKYDAALIWATIDVENRGVCTPWIAHTTPEVLTELRRDGYFTTGIASPYAELILKDAYKPQSNADDAKILIGAMIKKIGEVDNDVEGFDVLWIKCDGSIQQLADYEKRAIAENSLSLSLEESLSKLKDAIRSWGKITDLIKKKELEPEENEG